MSQSAEYEYVGDELTLFINATNWKRYWSGRVRPYVKGRVLDVGAGLGATFDYLSDRADSWTCLEPDAALCAQLEQRLAFHAKPPRVLCGTLDGVNADERFDTIVYIDVLEHIEHDKAQLEEAVRHLEPGGSLIVLSPALPALFSPFDRSVGQDRQRHRKSRKKRGGVAQLAIMSERQEEQRRSPQRAQQQPLFSGWPDMAAEEEQQQQQRHEIQNRA